MTQRIDALLPVVLKRAQRRSGALRMIQRRWSRLVGRTLAAHTKPVSFQRGRLVVHADRPGEGFALSYERDRLLRRLRTATNGRVEELVIRPGDVRSERSERSE